MSVRYTRTRSKLTCLATLLAIPILLAACGGGLSQEEFDAVQGDLQAAQARVQLLETQLQTEQAQAAALQQRLDRGAAIQGVLDALARSFEDGDGQPSAEEILEFSAVIQASGTPELQAKWVEIFDSVLASAGKVPDENQVAETSVSLTEVKYHPRGLPNAIG